MTDPTPAQVASLRALSLADKSKPNYEQKDPCSALYNSTMIHALCVDWERLRAEVKRLQEDVCPGGGYHRRASCAYCD